MKNLKKVLAILVVLVMVFSVVACGGTTTNNNTGNNNTTNDNNTANDGGNNTADDGGATGGNTSTRDTLAISCTSDSGTLDPMMLSLDIGYAMRMVYETLWDMDSVGNMVYLLATNLEIVEPTVWHVTLREGVTFSNGNTFNAEDALFSIVKGCTTPGVPPYLTGFNAVDSKVLDEYKIELVFDNYDLSIAAGMAALYINDMESYDEDAISTTPIGTGPYVVTEYVINSHLYMERRDGYWGDQPSIKYMQFKVLAEDFQRVNAIQTGAVDVSSVPFQDLAYVESLDGVTVSLVDTTYGACVYFNLTDLSVFYENPDARKAVALAIDNQAIVDIAYSGYAKPARLPVSLAHIDWTDDLLDQGVYAMGYDLDAAKQLAESSGLVGAKLKVICSASASDIAIGEIMQSGLREIGVDLEIVTVDAGSMLSIMNDPTEFDMHISGTSAPSMTIAQNYYAYTLYMVGGTFVTSPWQGRDRFLELIDGIMAITDQAELQARYKELTAIHVDALPWYGIVDQQSANAYNSDLTGYERMLFGNINYQKMAWSS